MKVAWRSWCSPLERLPDIRWPFSQARATPSTSLPGRHQFPPTTPSWSMPRGASQWGSTQWALGVCLGVSDP